MANSYERLQEEFLTMQGLSGVIPIRINSNQTREYNFMTILNPTDNSICLYPLGVQEPTGGLCRFRVLPYNAITLPIFPEFQTDRGFNVVWTNDDATQQTIPKAARIMLTDVNLGMNFNFASSAQLSATMMVDVSDRVARELGVVDVKDRVARELGKVSVAPIGLNDDAAIADPALAGSMIALMKGMLKQLQGTGPNKSLVELSGSNVALPRLQNYKVLATAVAVTDTTTKYYNLITQGGLTEDQIRQYKDFKISFINSHNQPATITLYTPVRALDSITGSSTGVLYTEATVLTATNGRLLLQSANGGTGASSNIKAIPALKGIHSNLIIAVTYPVAPTSGSHTISVEMGE